MNEKWSVYESNTQSYRSNMIASQSFLLVAGTFSIDRTVLGYTCVIIALFQLWFIWFRVIRVRTIICDYYKFNLGARFTSCGKELSRTAAACSISLDEETYIHNKSIRKAVNNELSKDNPKLKHTMRQTRIKLDLLLPLSFSLLWVMVLLCIAKVI